MASTKLISLFHLSVLLLTSLTTVSFAHAPHYTHPSHPPVAAPMPGHHHKGGHNHHHHPKPPTQPPMWPPTRPTKAPLHPPAKAPTPPTKAPTPAPPAKAPVHPPAKAPTPPTKAPTPPAPAKSPVHPPAKAPTPPPKYPPTTPIVKKSVAIQGVVFCKSCKYTGVDTLTKATPLANATVKIVCAKDKFHMVQKVKTDKNGYFYMVPPKLTTAGIGICKVLLAKSPSAKCSVPTNLHKGLKGAPLVLPPPTKIPTVSKKIALFTVGPFAYEAAKKCY